MCDLANIILLRSKTNKIASLLNESDKKKILHRYQSLQDLVSEN